MNSDPRNVGTRGVNRMDIITALADIARDAFVDELTKATRTCLNCEHFDEKAEMCGVFNQRPPARIIAFGCEKFEDQVPF